MLPCCLPVRLPASLVFVAGTGEKKEGAWCTERHTRDRIEIGRFGG